MTAYDKKSVTFTANGVPETQGTLSPGMILDEKFHILESLGEGGMGQVYRAEHVVLGIDVAVKVMYTSGSPNELAGQRFRREARLLASLDHPNIVRIYDAGSTPEGFSFVAMELLNGETMRDWVKRLPLESRTGAYIRTLCQHLAEIAIGLEYAHNKGVIHRDIKLSNMVLHRDTGTPGTRIVPKLIDFGIAKRLDESDVMLTMEHEIPGTLDYMAPEVIHGSQPDSRADIYSFGVALYEALTDEKPDKRTEERPRSSLHTTRYRLVPPHVFNPLIPDLLDRICLKALAPIPRERFENAGRLRKELARLNEDSPTGTDTLVHKALQPFITAKLFAGIGLAVGICLLAVLVILNRFSDRPVTSSQTIETANPSHPKATKISTPLRGENPSSISPESSSKTSKAISRDISNDTRNAEDVENATNAKEPKSLKDVGPKTRDSQPGRRTGSQPPPSPSVQELIQQADEKFQSLDYDGAEQLYQKAKRTNPNAGAAWYGLGRVAFEKSRYDESEQYMKRAVQKQNNPFWRINLGTVYERRGRTQAAVREWQGVLDEFPDNQRAASAARALLKRQGAYDTSAAGGENHGE